MNQIRYRVDHPRGRDVSAAQAALLVAAGGMVEVTEVHDAGEAAGLPVEHMAVSVHPARPGFGGEPEPVRVLWSSIGGKPAETAQAYARLLDAAAGVARLAEDLAGALPGAEAQR